MIRFSRNPLRLLVAVAFAAGGTTALAQGGGNGNGNGQGSPPSYTIVELDDGGLFGTTQPAGPVDISDAGNAVGVMSLDPATGREVAVFWGIDGSTSVLMPLANDGIRSFATALNDADEIVGFNALIGDDGRPLPPGGAYWPSPTADPVPLPGITLESVTIPTDINNDRVICGYSIDSVPDPETGLLRPISTAVVWRVFDDFGGPNFFGPVLLPFPDPRLDEQSQALALSENDGAGIFSVVGELQNPDPTLGLVPTAAVEWKVDIVGGDGTVSAGRRPTILDQATGARALDVNDLGDSAGHIQGQARVWIDGVGLDLADPKIRPPDSRRDTLHIAYGISGSRTIVGTTGQGFTPQNAIVWPSPTADPIFLEQFLPKKTPPFLVLEAAYAINDSGVIVGIGFTGDRRTGFLAIPQ